MTKRRLFAVVMLGVLMSACGGNDTVEAKCDDDMKYQNYERGKRIVVPEGLDPLEELVEMPIPKADPDAAPPAPGRCADMPPNVKSK